LKAALILTPRSAIKERYLGQGSEGRAVSLPRRAGKKPPRNSRQPRSDEVPADRLNSFLDWLRLEAIVRRSDLTEEAASKLADEIKQVWWAANKDRFIRPTQ
jgi:hypothetical protein